MLKQLYSILGKKAILENKHLFKNSIILMATSSFGNEKKEKLEHLIPDPVLNCLETIVCHELPLVQSVTFWKCREPWGVPERKICDNFFLIVASGSLEACVNGELRILERGDFMVVPEFVSHSFHFADGCREGSHFIAHFLTENVLEQSSSYLFSSPFLRSRYPDAVLESLERAVCLRNRNPVAAMEYMQKILQELMLEQVQYGHCMLKTPPALSDRLHRSFTFIHHNFANSISIGDIAQAVGLGEARFRNLFRKETGMAPSAYLARVRLIHAIRLLARYDYSLAEIATQSGFASVTYFITVFRQSFGTTPSEYRKIIRK